MKKFVFILIAICVISCQNSKTNSFDEGKWIDLSYAFDEQTIYWPTSPTFSLDTVAEGMTDKGYYYAAYSFCMAEHGGTHLDAPIHFAEGKQAADEIPLSRLIGESIVIDVSK